MPDTDEFWSVEKVTAILRIPQSTIYKQAQDIVLPGSKVGNNWRFCREAIFKGIDDSENKKSTPTSGNSK